MTRKLIFSIFSFFLFEFSIAQNNWTLKTEDTHLSIAVRDNAIYIDTLINPQQNWNWTAIPSLVPLLNNISIGGTSQTPNWVFQEATFSPSANGQLIILRFTSANPMLELKSTWSAKAGPGAVENWMTVQNLTGGDVTYGTDVTAGNLLIKSDNTVTLHRFDKTDVGNSDLYHDVINANINIGTNSSFLPYMMFDVNSGHGLYIGYEWELGGFNVTSFANPLLISTAVYPLKDDNALTQSSGAIFTIPSVYYGTYKGDIEDGSNRFKKWFWNYKITRSLYQNANEPWVEGCFSPFGDMVEDAQSYYDEQAAGGIECVKWDFGWYTNRDWNYVPAKWPNGFDFAEKAHKAGMKASVYMGGTYNDCDLTTIAGRDLELNAIKTRYDQGWFDMWRTDWYTAPLEPMPQTYNGVQNFLSIHDTMINTRPGYRYENCRNGGKYKGFAICRRMTFVTTNDGETSESFRWTLYVNSYGINPVQLKSDNNILRGPNTAAYRTYNYRTGMLGAWLSNADIKDPAYVFHIALYRSKQRPILRGGNIYHILPKCDGVNWDGMQYFNTELNRGSIFLFKPSATAKDGDSKIIKMKGLNRTDSYQITFQDRTYLNCTKTGAQLMDEGINVTNMSGDYASEIIWINDGPRVATTTGGGRCGAGPVTLQATATGLNWFSLQLKWYASLNGGTSLATGNSFTTPSISSNTTYYVEAADHVSASPRVAVLATISSAPPEAPTNISPSQISCAGESITLSAKGVGTLGWYSDSLAGVYLGSGTNYTTPKLNQNNIYYVQDSTCGASAHRMAIPVNVRPTPTMASTIPGSRADAGSVLLRAVGSKGSALNWYDVPTGGTSLGSGGSFSTPTINTSTTYYVEATTTGLQNLLTFSEEFDNAIWTKGNATVIANTSETSDPLGANTADKYICGTFSNALPVVNQNFSAGTPITNSVYLKKGTAKWVALSIQGTGYCWFDLENGVIGSTGGADPATKSIESVGNGWYRCSLSYSSGNPFGFTIHIVTGNNVTSFDSDGSLYVYIWGAQLNAGTSALPYQQTTSETVNNLGSICVSPRTAVTATITIVTELSKINESAFSIYPNPASENLNISLSDYSGDVHILIADLVGKTVLEKNTRAEENELINFSVKGLSPGVYCISVSSDKKYLIYKLMIE